ncbi:hypothetical protein DASC09_021430 [Saccharomycopsis crataegensis]|uniref:Eukaryotic translation initiation factor 3 subunit L n=1 Tax=Saccharomycopsis crataegensis TaxID=43959 RepID=A0AAV5QJ08_9ASCO|nr:hypothetical protein DASC09_021430 [Saccharomycopsis crataegensis]
MTDVIKPSGDIGSASSVQQAIPDQVKDFIRTFYKHFLENNVYELHGCYENTFNKLTDKYYTKSAWPDPLTEVAPLVDNDQIFLVLYSEVYYRHIYAKLGPTLEHRTNSYNNYCNLFNLILNHEGGPVTFELPAKWLWDIVDEFIYQFNQFSVFRSKLINKKNLSEQDSAELSFLQQHVEIWSSYSVLNALYSLIGRSKIYEQLTAQRNNLPPSKISEIAGPYGSLTLYKNLGYFSIIGLLRIHTLLGDFTLALKTMEEIELSKKSNFLTRVPGAHFTTYYYAGFCYLMMHRYADAIKTFSHILLYITRIKNISKSGQYDAITKKSEQMYALLTILIGLCPTRIDDVLHNNLKEKFSEQLSKIVKGGEASLKTIEELFAFGSPKFISISLPSFDSPELNIDAIHLHSSVFMVTVKNTVYNNLLKTYLNLYSSMELQKLLNFLESDDTKINNLDELKEVLLAFKLTNTQIKWTETAAVKTATNGEDEEQLPGATSGLLNGESSNVYDFDITINDNLIQIIEMKVARKFSDWFIRNTSKNYFVQDAIRNDRIEETGKEKKDKKTKKSKK